MSLSVYTLLYIVTAFFLMADMACCANSHFKWDTPFGRVLPLLKGFFCQAVLSWLSVVFMC